MKKLSLTLLTAFVLWMNVSNAQDCPRIFTKGDTLYTDPAPQYQWFRDQNPIPGATNQWYLPAKGGNFSVQVNAETTEFTYIPASSEKSIAGRIIDERYEPIADAVISFGINNVKSDAQGRFILTGLDAGLTTAIVTITKDGFWKNTQRVHFFDQATAPLTAMLEPLKVTNRFDAQKGATISERGFFLTFPPNSAVTESGQIYTGTINISLKRSFPSEDGFGLRMPGGDFSAIDANGQEKMLISYGFMSAEMNGSNGEKLKLASDKEATLEFYIPWEQNKTAPDSMPLWHFDETAGTWKPEGIARKVGPRYVGTVKHFSSWNCDVPRNRATVKGKARNCKGTLIPNVVISVGQRTVTANANGEYTSFVPSDTEFEITASVDTVSVTPLVESEERAVKDLNGSAVLRSVGLIDSTGTLTVWGEGVKEYSVDSGKTFHPKGEKLTFTNDYPKEGLAKDSAGCESKFRIYRLPKRGDCQVLDGISLAQEPIFKNMVTALTFERAVYRLSLKEQGGSDILNIGIVFPCLHSLSLVSKGLSSLPESLRQLINLKELDLQANMLTTVPQVVLHLTNLNTLYLNSNRLTSIPESINQLLGLIILDFSGNQLSSIPQSIGQLTKLRSMHLEINQLSSVPESIGQLTNLQRLHINNNQLTGVPESIGQLTLLIELYLSSNQLSSVPECLGKLTNLQDLDLSFNQLNSVPDSIGQLAKLQVLRLSNNLLTTLPDSITNLKDNLTYLDLRWNPIPEEEQAKIRSWLPKTRIEF